jgi:predicted ATPase
VKGIVLTGGPGAGKTSVAAALARAFPGRLVHVPEAATQVYTRLGTRWDQLDVEGRREVQQRIYLLQVVQEARARLEHRGKVLLLDRGTVDGAAYWPEGPDDYWRQVGTPQSTELRRYHAVLWLQTCAAVGAYDGAASNACRHEDPRGAVAAGEKVLAAWSAHPRLVRVDAYPTFEEKLAAVTAAVRKLGVIAEDA